jgi:serine protease Do
MPRWSRWSPIWLWVVVFALGFAAREALDLHLPRLSAQRRPAAALPNGPSTPSTPPPTVNLDRGLGDEAIYDRLARQYERFEQVNRTFELVARAVSPTVVHIVAEKTARSRADSARFEETGSGVIVRSRDDDPAEYVLTNNHVVEGAKPDEIGIVLQDGRMIHPDRVWSDSKSDIAVLRLPVRDLPAARLGDSDEATVGTWVLALGSPFGLTHSVSQGIISARNRHEPELQDEGVDNQDFLQTDAAINPGNSGGPLVNLKGEVIGINTAIASNGGGSEGVGFTIPINLARWIMDQLIAQGRVRRGAMGVNLDDLSAFQAASLGLDRPRGAQIREVHPASPAARADLRRGDIVLRFNRVEILNLNHLINLVAMAPIGQPVEVVVWRDRQELARAVTVADLDLMVASTESPERVHRHKPIPPVPSRSTLHPKAEAEGLWGLELVTVDAVVARDLGLPATTWGIGVLRVEAQSPVAASLKARDVIYAVDGSQVRSLEDLTHALARHAGPAPVELWVQRPATNQRFIVRVP